MESEPSRPLNLGEVKFQTGKRDFVLSHTQIKMYQTCQRKWGLHYLFYKFNEPLKTQLQFVRKLMPFGAFMGQVVDDTITGMLRHYQQNSNWNYDHAKAIDTFIQEYLDVSKLWLDHYANHKPAIDTHRQPIDRYFFEHSIPELEIEKVREDAIANVNRFLDSDLREEICKVESSNWYFSSSTGSGSDIPNFETSNKAKIYAKFDFIVAKALGIKIFDWKTTKHIARNASDYEQQMLTYALFAHDGLKYKLDHIHLAVVYLGNTNKDTMVDRFGFTAERGTQRFIPHERITQLRSHWEEHYANLSRIRIEIGNSEQKLKKLLPITDQVQECRQCPFRMCCEGYDRVKS